MAPGPIIGPQKIGTLLCPMGYYKTQGSKSASHKEEPEQLCPGDGVNEYQNAKGEFYGHKRFFDSLKELKGQPVEILIEAVFKFLIVFGNNAEPKDDVSLLGWN